MKKTKLLIGALLLSGVFAFTSCQISGGNNSTQSQTALPSSEIPSTPSSASTPGAISSSTTPSVPATPSTSSSVPSSSSTTPSVPATSSTTPSVPSATSSTTPTTPTASSTTPSSSSSTTLTYIVEFTTGTTQTIDSQTIEAGDKAVEPTNPTKAATAEFTYAFEGWYTEQSLTNKYEFNTAVNSNLHLYAKFTETKNQYKVKFLNSDDTEVSSNDVAYGAQIVAPETNPTKASTAQYSYTFAGWYTAKTDGEKVTTFPTVTGAVTYYARYTEEVRTYTVTWKNYDGTVLETDTNVPYGTTPSFNGTQPTKPETADYRYKFKGWDKELSQVEGDVEFTAVFEQKDKTAPIVYYTITWKDENGTDLLVDDHVEEGTLPSYPNANPTKAATAEYTYTFAGWTPEVESVTGEATYTATYNSVKNKYTYTFYDEDGTTPLKALNVDYGTQIEAPVNPTKADDSTYTYSFDGWYTSVTGGTKVTSFSTITSNVKYYARYTATAKQSSVDPNAISVNTAYSFTGSASQSSDVVITGSYQNNSTTISKLTIDASSGKCADNGGCYQINSGTVLSFSTAASAVLRINLHSYNYNNAAYTVTAPGVNAVDNDAQYDEFTITGAGNVSIAFNIDNTYIYRIEIEITGSITPATTYSITYVTEYGTAPANKTNVTEITSADLPELSASGYTFEGWFTNEARTTPAEEGSISSDVTLYAKWSSETLDSSSIHEDTALQFHNNGSGISNVVIWENNKAAGTQDNFTVSGSDTNLTNSGYLEFKNDVVVSFDLQIPSGKNAVLKVSYYYDLQGTIKIDSGSSISGTKSGASSSFNYIYTYNLATDGNVQIISTSSQNYLNWIAIEFIDASVTITKLDVSYMRIAQASNSTHGNGVYKTYNAKTVYKLNEAFDSTGIYGVATYSDSSKEVFYGSSLTYTGFDSSTAGEKTVTVSYMLNGSTQSKTFKVYVVSTAPSIVNNVLQVKVDSLYQGTIGAVSGGYNMFKTINQALDYLRGYESTYSSFKKLLYVESGTYYEKLFIDIPNLTIRGANKTDTTIEYDSLFYNSNYAGILYYTDYSIAPDGFEHVTDSTQTMTIADSATNCTLYDITISNYWNSYEKFQNKFKTNAIEHRALALLIYADKVVVQDCKLLGYQDTLEAMTGRSYFLNSYISGATDFIFGTNPTMYFKNCEIRSIYNGSTDGGYINAFKGINKNSSDYVTYGVIYDGCRFTKDDNVSPSKTAIARPWDYYSNVMIMNSELGSHISKTEYTSGTTKNQRYVCWTNGGQVAAQPTSENVHFYEYNNSGTGALPSAINGMRLLNSTDAANYNNLETIYGSANGYSSLWTPTTIEDTDPQTNTITITQSSGYVEGAFVEFTKTADSIEAFYKKSTDSNYTQVDQELVRKSNGVGRVDVVGLSAGTYSVILVDSSVSVVVAEANNLVVTADDRSGYAHFNNSTHKARTVAVGAYNTDGTLKTDADVIYVTDTNKNTVTYKGYTGLGEILAHASSYSNPLAIRIIGTIRTTQWNSKSYSGFSDKAALAALVVASYNGAKSTDGKYYAKDLIEANANSYSNDLAAGITTLNGLTSWGSSSDSYWNMMDVQNANNITVEGIGIDAGIYQWGFTFSKCNKIEVKNLTFDHYTEDAIGIQGGSNSDMNYGNFWIHNCTFNLGVNNWDVSDDQDKSDGDGSTDFKYAHNLTISYCTYNHTHKTNLIGANNAALQYNITLHHNFYNECSQRLPLMRQANVHMYNNYYYGNSFTGISVRAKANAFIENSYFNGKNPYMLAYAVKDSVDPVGTTIKAIGNVFDSTSTTTTSDQGFGFDANGIYVLTTSGSNDPSSYSANTSATRTTTSSNSVCNPTGVSTSYANFDTNSELFYYTGSASDVTRMDNASDLPTIIPGLAGAGVKGGTYADTTVLTPLTKYTLSYNANGHGTAPSSAQVAVISTNNLPTLSADGFAFGGWYYETACTNKVVANTILTSATTIYAKWTETIVSTLTYDANGHGTAPSSKQISEISSSDLPSLTASGCIFCGWFYETAWTTAVKTGDSLNGDTTIYAKWIDVSSSTVKIFDFEDGNIVDENNFFTVTESGGSASLKTPITSKEFNLTTFTKAIKFDSKPTINFSTTKACTLIIVALNDSTIKVDGTNRSLDSNCNLIMTNLSSGDHTISKGGSENSVYAIYVIY